VVDGGTFDFGAHADRFPGFVEPDPSYGGLRYWPAFGPGAFAVKLRVQLLRDTGPAIAPFTSFLLLQGLETLSLRMRRHTENARQLAQWLEDRDEVEVVHYAGLPSSPWHAAGEKYLPRGAGAVLASSPHRMVTTDSSSRPPRSPPASRTSSPIRRSHPGGYLGSRAEAEFGATRHRT
jgi:O-acetylhomoserine (thiol)-lyase